MQLQQSDGNLHIATADAVSVTTVEYCIVQAIFGKTSDENILF